MRYSTYIATALIVTTAAIAAPAAAGAAPASHRCTSTRPASGFYEAGRVASAPMTVPRNRRCSTISVSHIRDPLVPGDHCQTLLVGIFSADGKELTYTEPVEACSVPASKRTVLATGVPDGTRFIVLYDIDYLEPTLQRIRYRVWR